MRAASIGSLFSGVGGLELGLEACGLGPVLWQCDSDPAARAVLARHWPEVRRYEDVREVITGAVAPVAVLCGGFPCQPVSVAGKRQGQKDPRWLWPFFAAVVARLRPGLVFIENVPGLRSAGLRDVLADLADLGYDAQWDVFSAAEVGAPHLRRRFFLLAHTHGEGELQPRGGVGSQRRRVGHGAVAKAPWPTPTARDWRSGASNLHGVNARPLNEVVHRDTPGPLNPTWVEWLMGFPLAWTASASSATPASRSKRPSRSASFTAEP
jgi:DNA (cytosine-5)-methyltransferase 1